MPRKHRKPGRGFWIRTSAIGTISPERASQLVSLKVTELGTELEEEHQLNEALESDNAFLREELSKTEAEVKRYRAALFLDTPVTRLPPSWSQPEVDAEHDTITIPVQTAAATH